LNRAAALWFAKQRLAVAQLLVVRPRRPRHRQGSKSHGTGARFRAKPLPVSGSTLSSIIPTVVERVDIDLKDRWFPTFTVHLPNHETKKWEYHLVEYAMPTKKHP